MKIIFDTIGWKDINPYTAIIILSEGESTMNFSVSVIKHAGKQNITIRGAMRKQ